MKQHPIIYIKSYGLKLWFIQIKIMILNKLKILKKYKKTLIYKKNDIIEKRLTKEYNSIIKKYQSQKFIQLPSKKVFVFWLQGEESMPLLVKLCYESLKLNLPDSDIILLTQKNIKDYTDIPNYIYKKLKAKEISYTHFSDIIRASVLKLHGGAWIDSTIFLTNKVYQKNLQIIKTVKFHCDDKTSISNGKWCCFFLGGINKKLFLFLCDMYYEYWKKESIIIDYFLLDILIKIAYDNFSDLKLELDLIDFNNEHIHTLCNLLNSQFNEKEYIKLKNENIIHKLSYKVPLTEKINGNLTYWGYIKENFNEK